MLKAIIKRGDTEIKKPKFHQYKKPISIKNIDINKTAAYNKVSFGKKSFLIFDCLQRCKKRN